MVLQAFVLALSLLGSQAKANTIEGYTPSGQFATVGLDAQKNFKVAVSSLTALNVTVTGGTLSYITDGNITVHQAAGESFVVKAASSATTFTGQVTVPAIATSVYPADPLRKQGALCNNADITGNTIILYLGDSGVTTASGFPLQAGSCYSPDVPQSHVGEIFGISTATLSTSYIYHR